VLVTASRDGTLLDRRRVELVDDSLPAIPHRIGGVALRSGQPLPPAVAERIKDSRARNVADWVMYREILAAAAVGRGWPVYWYDPKQVLEAASQALGIDDFEVHFLLMRRSVGPPWSSDHKLAMAAAIVAAAGSILPR
jgi:hypothetical protein